MPHAHMLTPLYPAKTARVKSSEMDFQEVNATRMTCPFLFFVGTAFPQDRYRDQRASDLRSAVSFLLLHVRMSLIMTRSIT